MIVGFVNITANDTVDVFIAMGTVSITRNMVIAIQMSLFLILVDGSTPKLPAPARNTPNYS